LYATGWALEARAQSLDDRLNGATDAGQQTALEDDYDQASKLRWLGVAGPVLTAAAVPLLVRPRAHVPWWSWTLGAVGVALSGVGTWQLVEDGDCDLEDTQGRCVGRQDSLVRGALILGAAAPLLTLPLTHLLRRAVPTASAGMSAGAESVTALLRIQR
jgi:hypothetical protein